MAVRDPVKSVMKWVGLSIALGSLVGGAITAGSFVYATKSEVANLEKAQVQEKGATALRDYRIQKLEVQVQNVESIARRTDTNVEKLLMMRRIQPAAPALVKPLPPQPVPDSLGADEPER